MSAELAPVRRGDLLPPTRLILVAGFALTAGTGIGLFLAARRTEDYWAWTIADPLTAATMGACYTGAAVGLVLALRHGTWPLARPVVLAALMLTSLSLLATLRHWDVFAFAADGLPRIVAWIWVVVYVALPPLLAIVLEQRRGCAPNPSPLLSRALRVVLAIAAAACALYALALTAGNDATADAWPWPLPPLPAQVMGAWLATTGTLLAAAAWPGRRDTAIAGLVPAAVALLLVAVAILRFSSSLDV